MRKPKPVFSDTAQAAEPVPGGDTWLRNAVAQTYANMNNNPPVDALAATADHISGKMANSGTGSAAGSGLPQTFDSPPAPATQSQPVSMTMPGAPPPMMPQAASPMLPITASSMASIDPGDPSLLSNALLRGYLLNKQQQPGQDPNFVGPPAPGMFDRAAANPFSAGASNPVGGAGFFGGGGGPNY